MSTISNLSIIILYQQQDRLLDQAVSSAAFAAETILVERKNISDFAQVRNFALQKAKYDWVLFLDSDEKITPQSIKEIKKIIDQDKFEGIIISRQDIFYHQPLRFGEAGKTKLVRMGKKSQLSWERPVHEIAVVKGKVSSSKIFIKHYAHSSFNEFTKKIINYAQIEAKYRREQSEKFAIFQLLFYPPAKFILNYIFRLGFLDGWRGLGYAAMMSLHSLAVRVFLYELTLKKYEKNI